MAPSGRLHLDGPPHSSPLPLLRARRIPLTPFFDAIAPPFPPPQVVRQLETTGVLVVRDPRVTFEDNATFIDMMEDYFSQEEVSSFPLLPRPSIHPSIHPSVDPSN